MGEEKNNKFVQSVTESTESRYFMYGILKWCISHVVFVFCLFVFKLLKPSSYVCRCMYDENNWGLRGSESE